MRSATITAITAFFLFGWILIVFANDTVQIESTLEVIHPKTVDTIELSIFDESVALDKATQSEVLQEGLIDYKSVLPALSFLTLILGGIGFFLILKKEQLLRNFSMWALFHPKKTKVLLTGAQLLSIGSALFIGKELQVLEMKIPDEIMYASLGVIATGAAFYPVKRKATYSKNFKIRKSFDLILPMAAMIFLSAASNQYYTNPANSGIATTFFNNAIPKTELFQKNTEIEKATSEKQNKQNKIQQKRASVGKIIAAILLSILVLSLLLGATCALGCIAIGLGGGAAIGWVFGVSIWVIGTAFSVYLTIKFFNLMIDGKEPKNES